MSYARGNKNNSLRNTIAQQERDTVKRLAPSHAVMIPIIKANAPDMGLCVALRIAGKVITANVTYGT